VKTQFGWHVIILEDTRVQTPPPFEAVKAQLEPVVQREKLTSYLDSLRSSAQVEILVPVTEPTPAPVATVVETVTEEVTPTSDTVTETVEVVPAAE
jgi:peptidyl-prolyl cis-trans isomerase C